MYQEIPKEPFSGLPAVLNPVVTPNDSSFEKVSDPELEDTLVRSQRLAALGTLSLGIAHEFNNLLMTILGNAALARMDSSEPQAVSQALENIEASADQAARICLQLTAYAAHSCSWSHNIDLNGVVTEIVRLMRSTAGKQASFDLDLGELGPGVEGDIGQIRQIVLTLVLSAVQNLPDGRGLIRLATGVREFALSSPNQKSFPQNPAPGEYCFLEVQAIKPVSSGVPLEGTLERAAMLKILCAHRGAAQFEGAVSRIILPSGSNEKIGQPRDHTGAPADLVGTVLLVDDEELVRGTIARMLEADGLKVIQAGSGYEALESFPRAEETFDLVLLDSTMPHLTGTETLRAIRQLSPSIPVILMSGYAPIGTHGPTRDPQVKFLQKPFSAEELRRIISDLLRSQRGSDNLSLRACA